MHPILERNPMAMNCNMRNLKIHSAHHRSAQKFSELCNKHSQMDHRKGHMLLHQWWQIRTTSMATFHFLKLLWTMWLFQIQCHVMMFLTTKMILVTLWKMFWKVTIQMWTWQICLRPQTTSVNLQKDQMKEVQMHTNVCIHCAHKCAIKFKIKMNIWDCQEKITRSSWRIKE